MNPVIPPDTDTKLKILSQDSRYDLACACGTSDRDRRHRSQDNRWIYPVVLPDGTSTYLFKTLISNICTNDCGYCPLRAGQDPRRCALEPAEVVSTFMAYKRAGLVSGIFMSSGVLGSPDRTMERINTIARILRKKEQFRGYMHLKVIPGASDAAIEEALSLATTVSINIEIPGEKHFSKICKSKDYSTDIIRPLKLISKLTSRGERFAGIKSTTQFVVGASDETDSEIIKYMGGLYNRLHLNRIYFSAYQRGLGASHLPGEQSVISNDDALTREHRLYQSDWLVRKYKFSTDEIPIGQDGNLRLDKDPKEVWAEQHPEMFPVNINKANKLEIARVPGIGLQTADRILKMRKQGVKVRAVEDLGRMGKRLGKAAQFVAF